MLKEIKYVFSKAYKMETKYFELMERMAPKLKLTANSESVDEKINRIKDYESNCSIKIGSYDEQENNLVKSLALTNRY